MWVLLFRDFGSSRFSHLFTKIHKLTNIYMCTCTLNPIGHHQYVIQSSHPTLCINLQYSES